MGMERAKVSSYFEKFSCGKKNRMAAGGEMR